MKRRTKNLIVVIALTFMLGLSACESNGSNSKPTSLYSRGLEVVQIMSEMAESEAYISINTGDSAIKSIIQELANGDYSFPKAVYSVSVPEESLAAMAELDTLDNASDNLRNFILERTLSALMTQLNAMNGVESLAASSLCTASKTFVDENANGNVIYLYTYDDAVPIAVTFLMGDDNSVSAGGVFLMADKFNCNSADEIKASFNAITDLTVEVTEIQPEK